MSETNYGSRPLYSPGKVFLIGDVHNEANKLMSLIDQLTPELGDTDHIVFCGDLIDRGTYAALTIKTLVDLCDKYPDQVLFIRGNHDWMLEDYLKTGSMDWYKYLESTLLDLQRNWNLPDVKPATIAQALLNNGYREITSRTIPYYETEDLIATHAPIDGMVALMNGAMRYKEAYANKTDDFIHLLDRMSYEIMWNFTNESMKVDFIDKYMVCGHQPSMKNSPRLYENRAFIDTGCGSRTYGALTCLVFPEKKIIQSK